jgi:hypothetical protein
LLKTRITPTNKGFNNRVDKLFKGIIIIEEIDNNIIGYPKDNTIIEVFSIANSNYKSKINDFNIYISSTNPESVFNEKVNPADVRLEPLKPYIVQYYPNEIVYDSAINFPIENYDFETLEPQNLVILGYLDKNGDASLTKIENNCTGLIFKAIDKSQLKFKAKVSTNQGRLQQHSSELVQIDNVKEIIKSYKVGDSLLKAPPFKVISSYLIDSSDGKEWDFSNTPISVTERFVQKGMVS